MVGTAIDRHNSTGVLCCVDRVWMGKWPHTDYVVVKDHMILMIRAPCIEISLNHGGGGCLANS